MEMRRIMLDWIAFLHDAAFWLNNCRNYIYLLGSFNSLRRTFDECCDFTMLIISNC